MEQYIIKGGNPLVGDVTISGAKNAALGILAASIMTDDDVLIDLEGQAVSFEKLKPYIIFAAKNLAEMDVIAQKYSALHGDGRFVDGYEVTYVFLDAPDRIRLRYCGINQNCFLYFQYVRTSQPFRTHLVIRFST